MQKSTALRISSVSGETLATGHMLIREKEKSVHQTREPVALNIEKKTVQKEKFGYIQQRQHGTFLLKDNLYLVFKLIHIISENLR